MAMVFYHFLRSNSLNDVCNGMRSATGDLNHLGVTKAMRRSFLAYNNLHRNWELFQTIYFSLYDQFTSTLKKSRNYCLNKKYLLDSITIDLCLKVFDWAHFEKKKGAIKLHTVLDFDGCMPVFADLSDGKKYDVNAAHDI